MKTVVITQPMLFPWSGFFEQLMLADNYIYLDDTQYSKGSFVNRVQVEYAGDRRWMTIPLKSGGTMQNISDLEASDTPWRDAHRSLLLQSLAGAPYKRDAIDIFDEVYKSTLLLELLIASIEKVACYLGIGGRRVVSKSSEYTLEQKSWQKVLGLVQIVGGQRYVTGHGGANYIDHSRFDDSGISIEYMEYSKSIWRDPPAAFNPYVSILNLIGFRGPNSVAFLRPRTVPWASFKGE